jgi:hypothetical protein
MPTHLDQMAERLPHLYREGELLRGLLAIAAIQMEIAEEEARSIQRSHWFDTTLDLGEAVRLALPLDIPLEEWQSNLAEYRSWVHAIRNARLQEGAVTVAALQGFVLQYSQGFQRAVRIQVLPEPLVWGDDTAENELVFLENPPLRRYERMPGLEPLQRFSITQNGLFEAPAAFLLTGLPEGPECVPVIANLTTGQALVFIGNVPTGARLWLRPTEAGEVQAFLENEDVSDRLRSVADLQPGVAWSEAGTPARAITLTRGVNDLWFLPVAHYDALGLDRFLLALADLLMTQGRWDEAKFDKALFYQHAAVDLRMTWVEAQPATIEIKLPAASLANREGELEESLLERDRLTLSLNRAVQKLKAAGIRAAVTLEPFAEVQGQADNLRRVPAPRFREVGPTGADAMPDAGGVFAVTGFNDSTFR